MFFQTGHDNVTSAEPLYSNIQRFFIRNSFGEERPKDLRIVVDLSSVYSKVSKQVLQIQVLDDDDPFFYYTLIVTEDDYLKLKSSQGLLVDFDSFPSQVIRLLEQCRENDSRSAKFLLLLEEEGRADFTKTMLKIVETNNFKHLCHLVLTIELGSDEDIKKIMVKKIKSLKEQNCKAEKVIISLESQLSSKNMMLDASELKVSEIERRWKEDRLTCRAETAKELTEETEKLRRAQLDWQLKSQREKAELEEKFHNSMREKEGELSKMRVENQILLDKKSHCEAAMNEQTRRIETLEKELACVRTDLATTRKQLSKIEHDAHDKERQIANLRAKLATAEHDFKEKAMLLSRQEDLLKSAQEQKVLLEKNLQEKDSYVAKKQKTIQNVSEELIKANEIISKLQKELSSSASKLKTRTEIALEQERVIEKHEKVIERLEKEVKMKTKKLECLDENEETLKTTLVELKETLEAKDKKIKENEKIIDWLNRRCTEQAVQSYASGYSNLVGPGASPSLGCPSMPLMQPTLGNPIIAEPPPPTPGPQRDIKTSTPFERFKDIRVPFTTVNTPPSRFNILALDKMMTPSIAEEEPSENEDPSPEPDGKKTTKTKPDNKKTDSKSPDDKKKASPVDPPNISSKPSRKATTSKKPPNATPAVPSSYFFH